MEEGCKEEVSEEEIILEMVEQDFVVKMPPKKKYKIHTMIKKFPLMWRR